MESSTFKCSECLESFDSKSKRTSHWRKFHQSSVSIDNCDVVIKKSENGTFKCNFCFKEFELPNSLTKHLGRNHSNNNNNILNNNNNLQVNNNNSINFNNNDKKKEIINNLIKQQQVDIQLFKRVNGVSYHFSETHLLLHLIDVKSIIINSSNIERLFTLSQNLDNGYGLELEWSSSLFIKSALAVYQTSSFHILKMLKNSKKKYQIWTALRSDGSKRQYSFTVSRFLSFIISIAGASEGR